MSLLCFIQNDALLSFGTELCDVTTLLIQGVANMPHNCNMHVLTSVFYSLTGVRLLKKTVCTLQMKIILLSET